MDFLKSVPCFDFIYGDTPFSQLTYTLTQQEEGDTLTRVYAFPDGLTITNVLTCHGDAFEWVNHLENTGDAPTQILSQLWDACVSLPLPHEEPLRWTAYQPAFSDYTAVYAPSGSTWSFDEFTSFADRSADNRFAGHLTPGKRRRYATSGGRSSEKSAPFFNIHKDGKGYIVAIGWSGQWNCEMLRTEDAMLVKTKIEDTHFRLLPGEKIRTSSFVVMPYEGSVEDSYNKWRRLVRDCFSLIGQPGRDAHGPLCSGVWGGMETEAVLKRIETIQKNALPYEYLWMDAGWYGIDTQPTPDEFEGDWSVHTGDWRVSPLIHTNNLRGVADAAHKAGLKFLLWLEPERVICGTPITKDHPEYFFTPDDEKSDRLLLNLGDPAAWTYCYETIAGLIRDIGIDCYRQDFNMPPLADWRKNDVPDRQGISEIKHIMGLYRLWDALLEEFPHLLIDNCASGGRRIDIETLRRSIPLWRSDYQCPANFPPEGSQCHHLSFNRWMPFSGTGSGRIYDTYNLRSSYSPALTFNFTFSNRESFGDDPAKMAWLKARLDEYIRVRELMNEDFYPLTQPTDRLDVWCASQFDRPSQGDGCVQIFRREDAPYETASYVLRGLDAQSSYVFTDADDGSEQVFDGAQLLSSGLRVTIPEKRTSRLYFYHKR